MTLAEIIEEGKRLEERYARAAGMTERLGAHAWRDLFYQKHGATLLAVAEAAVSHDTSRLLDGLRDRLRFEDHSIDIGTGECIPECVTCADASALRRVRAAFDAAASGEGRG